MDVVKTGKKFGSKLWESALFILPAIGGGAIGAGIGRNSLYAGLGTIALARWRKWPDWVQFVGVGMATNGVATALPVNEDAKAAVEAATEGEQLSGFGFVQDGFKPRAQQYLKNIALKAHLDKVPVVNTTIGLAGIDQQMISQGSGRKTLRSLPPKMQSELNRIIGNMGTDGASLSGVDAKLLSSPGMARERRKRATF